MGPVHPGRHEAIGSRARPDALGPLRRVRYWADRHGSPKHHLEYGSQSRNVDQVGHQLKFRQQKVGNETASGSSPITAGATLAPTGNKLTGTPGPYGREELLPIDARARAADYLPVGEIHLTSSPSSLSVVVDGPPSPGWGAALGTLWRRKAVGLSRHDKSRRVGPVSTGWGGTPDPGSGTFANA